MKWLLIFSVILFLAVLLIRINWGRLKQINQVLVREPLPLRSAADAATPVAQNLERHQEFLDRIKEGDIDVLFLGDSITDFWPQIGEKSWVRLAKYKPANFGISGQRTEHLLWRIQHGELDGIDPKVVVVLIGTNNLGHDPRDRPEWVAEGIRQIVQTIRSRLPKTRILLLGVFPRNRKASPWRQAVTELNRQIEKLADGNTVVFADLGSSFLDSTGEISPDIMPDELHLTAKGYDIWYESLDPLLAKLTQAGLSEGR